MDAFSIGKNSTTCLPGQKSAQRNFERKTTAALLRSFWTVRVLFEELFLFVVERSELAFAEEVAHVGCQFERIAVGVDEIRDFPRLDRADLICDSEDLCGIE